MMNYVLPKRLILIQSRKGPVPAQRWGVIYPQKEGTAFETQYPFS